MRLDQVRGSRWILGSMMVVACLSRTCRSQMQRAGTVMTAQTEAVDFFAFDNSYARLPDRFFARLRPTPIAAPRLVRLNNKLAWRGGRMSADKSGDPRGNP